jgi:hypothetical protein
VAERERVFRRWRANLIGQGLLLLFQVALFVWALFVGLGVWSPLSDRAVTVILLMVVGYVFGVAVEGLQEESRRLGERADELNEEERDGDVPPA